jgi:ribonuclease Z
MIDKRVGRVRLLGRSLAGEETVLAAPEQNVCFDIGRAPREVIPIDNICLSHGHIDHSANIAYYFSHREFIGAAPGRLIVHRQLAPHFQSLMAVWADIEGRPGPCRIEPVLPGDEVRIRRDLLVRAVEVNHDPRSLGFAVLEERFKLKPELADHTGPQLVELKQRGVEIQNRVEIPMVAYCGDTADGPHFDLDCIRNAEVLLLECTFFEPEHVIRARKGKHIHVRDLPGILDRLRCPNVVLTHVTHRTALRDARRMLKEIVSPGDLERLVFFMDRPKRSAATAPD